MAAKSAALTINVIANAAKAKAGFGDASKAANTLKGNFDQLKTMMNGPVGMVAGFAAIGKFAMDASAKFQGLAKSALDMGKATGLGTEQASRWIAVADDMGVSSEALSKGFKAIVKDIDANKWKKYGIATRDAGGQARKSNDIFLDTLDILANTKSPTERAIRGTELLGKSYEALAPIIGGTRQEYEAMLASVEAGQVITSEEAAQSEKMRLAQDALGDAFGEVQLAAGGFMASLAPLISAMATVVGWVGKGASVLTGTDSKSMGSALTKSQKQFAAYRNDIFGTVSAFEDLYLAAYNGRSNLQKFASVMNTNPFGGDSETDIRQKAEAWTKAFNTLLEDSPENALQAAKALQTWYAMASDPTMPGMKKVIEDQAAAWGLTGDAIDGFVVKATSAWNSTQLLNQILEDQNDILDGLISEWEDYLGLLNIDQATTNAKDALLGLTYAFDDPTTAANEFKIAQQDAATAVADFIKQAGDIPEDVQIKMQADLASGNLPAVWAVINTYMKDHPLPFYSAAPPWVKDAAAFSKSSAGFNFPKGPMDQATIDRILADAGLAAGGPVSAGSTYVVGENGPELFTSNRSGTIIPNGAFGVGGGGAGGVQYVTINMPAGANGAELVRALQAEARRTGQIALPVSSKTVR